MNNKKPIYVTFGEIKIEKEFEFLKEGRFQDKELYEFINRAMKEIKLNPLCGIKISKRIWPRIYIIKNQIIDNCET